MLVLGIIPLLLQGLLTAWIATKSILENNRVIADKDLEKMAEIDAVKLRNFSNFLNYLTQEETLLDYLEKPEDCRVDVDAFMRTNKVSFAADYAYEYLFATADGIVYSNLGYLSEAKRQEVFLLEQEAPWYQALHFHYDPSIWVGVHEKITLDGYRPKYIYLARNIIGDSGYLGRAVIGFNPKYLQGDLGQAKITDHTNVYILDDDRNCVIECEGNSASYNEVRPVVDQFMAGSSYDKKNENLILSKAITLPGVDMKWHIISITPYKDFRMRTGNMAAVSVCLLLLSITGVVLFCCLIHEDVFKPVKSLQQAMVTVVDGNFDVTVTDPGTDELADLSEGFSYMQTQLKSKIEEVRASEIAKKKLEVQILQEQINPHFIGNALNTIKVMADLNQDMAVSKALQALHHLVSHYLKNGDAIISLQEEIDYLEEYLYLQKLRYHNSFSYAVTIWKDDLETEQVGIMKLLLQPLVENSIIHSFSDRYVQGRLDIMIDTVKSGPEKETEDILEIQIIDNGTGVSEEKMLGLLNETDISSQPDIHIGVRNVQQRIQLEYGKSYGLFYENNHGTCVTVKLPLIVLN